MAADRALLGPGEAAVVAAQKGERAVRTLARLRKAAASEGTVRVIVGLRVPFAPEARLPIATAAQQRREISDKHQALMARLPSVAARAGAVKRFDTVPFSGLSVTAGELELLAQLPEVDTLYEDALHKPALAVSVPNVGAPAAWSAGYTGAGQAVAVLDTGVDKNHPFLTGKVVSEACYSTTDSIASSVCPGGVSASTAPGSALPCGAGCEHGTHVAGIVAGNNGPAGAPAGVARGANIIAVQVYSTISSAAYCPDGIAPCYLSYTSDMIRGLERVWALRATMNVAAANISAGAGQYSSQATCDAANAPEKTAIDNLRAAGIATVVSSGNEGFHTSLAEPACISSAISVGATFASQGYVNSCAGNNFGTSTVDAISCYSNSASFLSLLAPGSVITSSVPGTTYATASGTSMAAPHVAGAWAVMKQIKPTASVDEILASLVNSGVYVLDPRNQVNKPRINIGVAMDFLGSTDQVLGVSTSGAGTVASSPAGIACGATCSRLFPMGTVVTLTATPTGGSTFTGWTGACSGGGSCTVTMSAARSVTAVFTSPVTLSVLKDGGGAGTVTRSGGSLACGLTCSETVASGSAITLSATPATGSTFTGWSAPCPGQANCAFNIVENTTVTANFAPTAAPGSAVSALLRTGLAAPAGSTRSFSFGVPAGARNLVVKISGGTGDADLYVRAGSAPTYAEYDCRPFKTGNEESCTFPVPVAGSYMVMLDAYLAYSGVTLSATYQQSAGAREITNILNLLLSN